MEEVAEPNPVDRTLLYATLEPHYPRGSFLTNALDYNCGVAEGSIDEKVVKFPISELQGYSDWKIKRGSESVVLSPDVSVDKTAKLMQQAISLAEAPDAVTRMQELRREDPFSSWKDKFYHDFPCVTGFLPHFLLIQRPHSIFWKAVYAIFKSLDNGRAVYDAETRLALRNRARI